MEKYKLTISILVKDDLVRISNYLSRSKFKDVKKELLAKCRNLSIMPRMYPRLYYKKDTKTDYRKIIFEKHIIIYKIQKNQITILRIVSEKENYLKPKLLEIY